MTSTCKGITTEPTQRPPESPFQQRNKHTNKLSLGGAVGGIQCYQELR